MRLPDRPDAEARAAVDRGDAAYVSSYVAEAPGRRRVDEDLAALLAEMIAEHGEPSADDYAWADRALGLARPRSV